MSFRRALLPLIAVFAAAFSAPAKSASPEGLWLAEDQTGRIRIEKCGNEMWGFLAWQKEARSDSNARRNDIQRPSSGSVGEL